MKIFLGSATDATGDESDEDADDDGQQHSQAENGGSVAALTKESVASIESAEHKHTIMDLLMSL